MFRPIIATTAMLLVAAVTSDVQSQGIGMGGSSAFGRSSMGGFGTSGFGGMSGFGNSGFGGMGGMGSSGFGGMGGFGNSGFGGMGGFGNSGFGGMGGFGNTGFGNTGFGTSGYNSGQNFVGRDAGDIQSSWNQMGQAGAEFFNQMNRQMGRSNRSSRSNENSGDDTNAPLPMRVQLQVAFATPVQTPAQLSNNVRARITQILAAQNIVAPQITMDGNVVVLGGVAATESQRLVLERLVAMEPGVREVRNEMTVVPATVPPQSPPGGN